jgi:hypothetical protein
MVKVGPRFSIMQTLFHHRYCAQSLQIIKLSVVLGLAALFSKSGVAPNWGPALVVVVHKVWV